MRRWTWLLLASCVPFFPAWVFAQATGSIRGTVSDPAGAVIPRATVTAVQRGTEFSRETNTSSSGDFTLPLLPVGTYDVTAKAPGFQSSAIEIKLDVDQKQEVNFKLT